MTGHPRARAKPPSSESTQPSIPKSRVCTWTGISLGAVLTIEDRSQEPVQTMSGH